MKKLLNPVFTFTMPFLFIAGILFTGCKKIVEETNANKAHQLEAFPVSDSMTLDIYDSLGREFEYVKRYPRKVTIDDTASFNKEAYAAFYEAIKGWH